MKTTALYFFTHYSSFVIHYSLPDSIPIIPAQNILCYRDRVQTSFTGIFDEDEDCYLGAANRRIRRIGYIPDKKSVFLLVIIGLRAAGFRFNGKTKVSKSMRRAEIRRHRLAHSFSDFPELRLELRQVGQNFARFILINGGVINFAAVCNRADVTQKLDWR